MAHKESILFPFFILNSILCARLAIADDFCIESSDVILKHVSLHYCSYPQRGKIHFQYT